MLQISKQQSTYPIALLLSSEKRKTNEALGRTVGKSGDTMLRLLEHNAVISDQLVDTAKSMFKQRDVYLVLDDTLIEKMYSRLIEGTSDNRDHSTGQVYRSLCSVVAMLTDGNRGLAVDQMLWTSKEMALDNYITKTEIAKTLIETR